MQRVEYDVRDIPSSPIFGLEAIFAIFFGVMFCCCNTFLVSKTNNLELALKKLAEKYPSLKFVTERAFPIPQGAPRIDTDDCCFCMNNIVNEVNSTCGHVFCGKLQMNYN
jgi:hypothetical protein